MGAALGPGQCRRRPPRGRRGRREPYRHGRLLRTARHQPDHPAGPAPVPDRGGDRHQARCPPPSRQVVAAGHLARRPDHRRPRQPPQLGPGRARHRQLPRDGVGPRPRGGIHRRAGDGTGRPPAQGADPPHRSEQRHGRPGGRGAGDRRRRVRAEQLQPGPSPRRRPDRRLGPTGHRLRAVLPARRVLAAAVVHPVVRRRPTRGHADAGRAGVAAAPIAQHPVDPRHVVSRPPP